jgi:hypothetical protein
MEITEHYLSEIAEGSPVLQAAQNLKLLAAKMKRLLLKKKDNQHK